MQAPATALSPSAISRTKPTSLIGSRCLGSEFFSIQMIQAGHQDNQCEGARSSRPEFLFWLSKLDSCHSPISVSSRDLRDDRGRLRDSRVIKVRAVRPPGARSLVCRPETRAHGRDTGGRIGRSIGTDPFFRVRVVVIARRWSAECAKQS